jgi:plastocyanin
MLYRISLAGRFTAAFLLGALVLAACGGSPSNSGNGAGTQQTTTQQTTSTPQSATAQQTATAQAAATTVTIPQGHELFSPFILVVQPGTKVTWQNNDTSPHTIMTTSDHNSFLNPESFSLNAAAGQQTTFTFSQPGIYDYYDNTQAKWNSAYKRVAANKGVPDFPLAMEGVIWVQGAISGLPSSVSNGMPDADIFTTDFVAISQGGTVTWTNTDGEEHFVVLVSGWSKPINPMATTTPLISLPGHGMKKSFTFQQPGLYYYYCIAHAHIIPTWHRAATHGSNRVYPLPMEGFVLVGGS